MGGGAPVLAPAPDKAEEITSSGTTQQGSETAPGGAYASVCSDGGSVYVVFGQNPIASASTSYMVPAGGCRDFGPLKEGDKIAVIDV
ncbi:hypothetical protein RA26_01565 [Leisingera sp. ANG-M7]|nr:hypothetical protein RA26_01565 [Leisingera sp. ANG-M7]